MTPADPSTSITAPAAHEPQASPTAPLEPSAAPVSLDEHRRHMMAALRHVEAIRDELINQLDEITGDADLEDCGDDEPTLGAPEIMGGAGGRLDQRRWVDGYHGHDDEREIDADNEPSLGSIGSNADAEHANQSRWADGATSDAEEQCEDEGAQCDDEGHNSDDEGDAQAPCHSTFADPLSPWPPRGSITWTRERPNG